MRSRSWRQGAARALGAAGALAVLRASVELVEEHRDRRWATDVVGRLRTDPPPACAPPPAAPTVVAAPASPPPPRRAEPPLAEPRRPVCSDAAARDRARPRGRERPGWLETWSFDVPQPRAATRGARPRPRRRAGSRLAARLTLPPLICAVVIWALVPGQAASRSGRGVPAALSRAIAGIPASYVALYQRAAREYGLSWTVLAAVGAVESQHGASRLPGVRSGSSSRGAVGPAQFLPSTWARYGVDPDGDGRIDPYDPADAIPAMAAYLKASGAPEDWPRALYAYDHSWTYVDDVLARSRAYAHAAG